MIYLPTEQATAEDSHCIRLRVQVLSGRGEEFKDKGIVRDIEMLPRHTLDELHYWIGRAFDMDNDHLWEFYVGPRRPYVRTGRITCGEMGDYGDVERIAWEVTLEDLKLRPRKTFYYVLDFGDSWWYKISVAKLKAPLAEGAEYPRIVERIGKSPEQYPVYDDDEDDEDEDLHCWRGGEA